MSRDLAQEYLVDAERSLDELGETLSIEEYELFLRKKLASLSASKGRQGKKPPRSPKGRK